MSQSRPLYNAHLSSWLAVLLLIALPLLVHAQDAGTAANVTIRVVQRGESLTGIAEEYGIPVEELARINGLTNPDSIQVGQRLLVPLDSTTPADQPSLHVVQPGESLRSIAALYALDPYQLAADNSVTSDNPLFVGQVLTVVQPATAGEPVAEPDLPDASTSTDNAGVETIPSDNADLGIVPDADEPDEPAPAQPVAAVDLPPSGITLHTVAPGETLYRIAQQYDLTTAEVAAANSITDPTLIFVGQQLIIPGSNPQELALDLPAAIERITVEPLVLTEGETGRFRVQTAADVTLSARFLDRDLPVITEANGTQLMLIGVPVFTAGGVYPLSLTLTDADGTTTNLTINLQILAGSFRSERITLTGEQLNLLDDNMEAAERQILADVMSGFTPFPYFSGTMSLPAAATMNSPFGSRRSYNGSDFTRFHSGADFAGAAGTPVLAAAPGVVVLADRLNICGLTTAIDHGWGIYTAYCHQSEQYVQPGETVDSGQVIGLIGSTGRTTGAHLHWELWVNGVPVDPMQWVRQSFFES